MIRFSLVHTLTCEEERRESRITSSMIWLHFCRSQSEKCCVTCHSHRCSRTFQHGTTQGTRARQMWTTIAQSLPSKAPIKVRLIVSRSLTSENRLWSISRAGYQPKYGLSSGGGRREGNSLPSLSGTNEDRGAGHNACCGTKLSGPALVGRGDRLKNGR